MYSKLNNYKSDGTILDNKNFSNSLEKRLQKRNESPNIQTEIKVEPKEIGMCNASDETNICGTTEKLLPIMDPRFNFKQIAGNMLLLEDHLNHPGMRCKDCIKKHMMLILNYLQESVSLDVKGEYTDLIRDLSKKVDEFYINMSNKINQGKMEDKDCIEQARILRLIRKPLCQQFATFY